MENKKLLESRKEEFKNRETRRKRRREIYEKYKHLRDSNEITDADIARRFGMKYGSLRNIIKEFEMFEKLDSQIVYGK